MRTVLFASMRRSVSYVAVMAVLLFVAITFHRAVVFRADRTFPWDFVSYHLPLATAYADSLSERQLPQWDPFTYCGRPLLANPQSAVFYPGMLLAALPGRDGLLQRLEWLAVAHVVLSGWLTFFLALRLGLKPQGAILAGLAFEAGAFFASQAQHLGQILSAPWLILSWFAILQPPRRRVLLLAFSWTMSFFAGFVAFTVTTCLATAVFVACWKPGWRVWRDFGVSAVLALGMSCVQWAPTLELVNQSVGKYRSDWLSSGGGIPVTALVSLIAPDYHHVFDLSHFQSRYDPTMLYVFSGFTTLLLAIVALRFHALRALALCLSFLILMLGEHTPVGTVAYALFPTILKGTVYWYVFLAPFTLALTLLAGEGASRLGRATACMACFAVAAELIVVSSNRPMNSGPASGVVTAVSLDGSNELASRLRALAGDLRIDTANDGLHLMAGAPILRWRAANGYDPLALERLIQARGEVARVQRWGAYYQVQQPDSAGLDAMSVRVVTSRTRLHTARLQEAGELPGRWVYVNPSAMPRYRAQGCALDIVSETRNRIEITAECARPSVLETSEAYYTAWKAEIDGTPAPVSVTHKAFRAVPLPAGRRHVVLRYSTSLLLLAGAISLVSWGIWLGYLRGQLNRKRGPTAG